MPSLLAMPRWRSRAIILALPVLGACAAIGGLGDYSNGQAPVDATAPGEGRHGETGASAGSTVDATNAVDAADAVDATEAIDATNAIDAADALADASSAQDASFADADGGGCPVPCGGGTPICNPSTHTCVACPTGFGDCDGNPANGCEVDLQTDPNHCGTCATTCTSGLCGTSIKSWTVSPPLWQFNGSARTDVSGHLGMNTGFVTELGGWLSGTIIYAHPVVTDSFTATFRVYLGGGGGADGMGFMWQTQGPTALGANAGCLGMCGLPGFGVEFDTYDNGSCGEPNANHVGVDQLSGCSGLPTMLASDNGAVPNLRGTVLTVVVQMTAGKVSESIGGTTYLNQVALPGFVSGTPYYFGFAGANGGADDYHEIANDLTITFPTPRCL
ncbi:MAG: lectin-like domain-containing protein [Polyangiaceae bacterium]